MKPTNKLKNLHPAIIAAIITVTIIGSFALSVCTLGAALTAGIAFLILFAIFMWIALWMLVENLMRRN